MSKLIWDQAGKRFYETGVDRGVLYVQATGGTYPNGVAWDGLISVSESPSGAEAEGLYADNTKYLNLVSAEDFGATIEAYQSPVEFDECDGTVAPVAGVSIGQQSRKPFGLAYRTKIGNDTDGDAHGYKIHIIYNALAAPSGKDYQTVNESPEAMTLSWEISTTPVNVTGYKPTATMVIDSTKAEKEKLEALEEILYGSETDEPRLPLPDEIISLMGGVAG